MLTAAGLGSGLDVEGILGQLLAIERQPINVLEDRKDDYQAELSAIGRLKSSVSSFQSAMADLKTTDAFEVYKAISDDEDVFTASAGSAASVGTLDIQVVNLAEAHKLGSSQFADTDTTIVGGAGDQITFTIGTNAFTVDVSNMTLGEIRDAINSATDNAGVSATIISETASQNFLVLTATESGTANSVGLSFTGGVGATLGMSTINTAEDAQLLVDGTYSIARASNNITDAVDGLTLNLKAESTGAVTLNIERDIEAVTESVQSFVSAFNDLRATIDDLRLNELQADSTLRSIESGMISILNNPPAGLTGSYNALYQAGLSIQKDGTMTLDTADLETAANADFTSLANLFANDNQGYVYRLESLVQGYLDPDGIFDNREDGINNRIDRADDQIDNLEYRLGLTEERLRRQFSALDALVGQLTATSSFLSQQLAGL